MQGMALPQGVANERQFKQQQAMVAEALLKQVHIGVARDIYSKLIVGDYFDRLDAARHKAHSEADPYGTRSDDEVERELPDSVEIRVDYANAMRLAISAANVFVVNMGLADNKGNPLVGTGSRDGDGGEETESPNEKPSGIILH